MRAAPRLCFVGEAAVAAGARKGKATAGIVAKQAAKHTAKKVVEPVAEPVVVVARPTVAGVKCLRPAQCRSYLRREAAAAFPEVVGGFLEQARTGSCQHLRFLTEMFEETQPRAKRVKGPAEALVEEWLR